MSNSVNSIAVEQKIINRLQIKEIVFVITFSILLSVLFHLIPSGSTPLGAKLLPIYYAPFIAVLFFRFHTAITVALLSPVCNYLVTGMPRFEIVGLISLELIIFVLISKILFTKSTFDYVNASLSFILTVSVTSVVIALFPSLYAYQSAAGYFLNTITNGVTGIIMLTVINFFVVKLYNKLKK